MARVLWPLWLLWLALTWASAALTDEAAASAALVAALHLDLALLVVLFLRYRWLSRATMRWCRCPRRPGP